MTTRLPFRSARLIALLLCSGTLATPLPGYAQQVLGAVQSEVEVHPAGLRLVDAHTARGASSSSLIDQCFGEPPAPGNVVHKRPFQAFYLSLAATAIPAGVGVLLWRTDPTALEISGAALFVAGTLIGPSLGLCYAEDYALRDVGLFIRGVTYGALGIATIVGVMFFGAIFGLDSIRLDVIEFGLFPFVLPIGVSAAFDVLISPYAAHLYNERGGPRYSFDISLPDPLDDLIDGLDYGIGLSLTWHF